MSFWKPATLPTWEEQIAETLRSASLNALSWVEEQDGYMVWDSECRGYADDEAVDAIQEGLLDQDSLTLTSAGEAWLADAYEREVIQP